MRLHPAVRSSLVVLATILATACGGGGGGDALTEGPPAPAGPGNGAPPAAPALAFTYDGETLPGRIIATSSFGHFTIYDLASGSGTRVGDDADVWWEMGHEPSTLVRWDNSLYASQTMTVAFFDTTTWQKNGPDLTVRPNLRYPKLSPDGKHVLAMWRDEQDFAERYNNPPTIIERATGRIVKRDWTLIKGEIDSLIGSPIDWLPDGSYIFLDGRRLYRGTVDPAMPATRVATLPLEDNLATGGADSRHVHLRASPDGSQVAFTWNGHIWVVGTDGGNLHRLTEVGPGSTNQVLGPSFGSPTWSPDSRWVAGVLYRSGVNVAPVFPDTSDDIPPPYQVVGTTGCVSPVFVLRADASAPTPISWPSWPVAHGVRVKGADGRQVLGLSVCSDVVHWIR